MCVLEVLHQALEVERLLGAVWAHHMGILVGHANAFLQPGSCTYPKIWPTHLGCHKLDVSRFYDLSTEFGNSCAGVSKRSVLKKSEFRSLVPVSLEDEAPFVA